MNGLVPIRYTEVTYPRGFQQGVAMARKTAVVWAAEDTAEALHAQYWAEPVPEVRTRLHVLWLVRRGESPTAVASAVGVSRRSVQRWLGWYREGGLARVRSHRRGGPGRQCGTASTP